MRYSYSTHQCYRKSYPKGKKARAKAERVKTEVSRIKEKLVTLDGVQGVDMDTREGQLAFVKHEIPSKVLSGTKAAGFASIKNGELQSFALSYKGANSGTPHTSEVRFQRHANGTEVSIAPLHGHNVKVTETLKGQVIVEDISGPTENALGLPEPNRPPLAAQLKSVGMKSGFAALGALQGALPILGPLANFGHSFDTENVAPNFFAGLAGLAGTAALVPAGLMAAMGSNPAGALTFAASGLALSALGGAFGGWQNAYWS